MQEKKKKKELTISLNHLLLSCDKMEEEIA